MAGGLEAWPKPLYCGLWWPVTASCDHLHPPTTNGSKGSQGPHWASSSVGMGGGGGRGLQPSFLPEDMWSGQSWSRVGNYASNKIRDVLLFFSGKSHSLTRMIFGYGTAHYCCLCCFLLCSGQFVKSFRVSKASNVSSVTWVSFNLGLEGSVCNRCPTLVHTVVQCSHQSDSWTLTSGKPMELLDTNMIMIVWFPSRV